MMATPTDQPAEVSVQNSHFATRATTWRLRTQKLPFGPLPLLMGIVNVTPDSFSDGGRFFEPQAAIEQALALIAEGAAIIDIGGESTRPYSESVSPSEELNRVVAVIRGVAEQSDVPISIDTSKALIAREAIAAGAQIINDVTALLGDPAMLDVALESGAGICAMHMQGTPQTMQDDPRYADVVREVRQWLGDRRDWLHSAGVDPSRICLDPGIGFGKTHQHNLSLLAACNELHALGCPLLVGPSRKGFIAKVIDDKQADRLPGTIGVALSLARQGVQIIRLHDVRPIREALLLFAATGGLDSSTPPSSLNEPEQGPAGGDQSTRGRR